MATIALKGNQIHTAGNLPMVGLKAPGFSLVRNDLSEAKATDFAGKRIVMNIFPSLDTPVCAMSVRRFNAEAERLANTVVLCISRDLPFAQARFCGAEGLQNVLTLSGFRSEDFGLDYGVTMVDGPLAGLYSRAIVIIDPDGRVSYTEQVPEITQEPDYSSALNALR